MIPTPSSERDELDIVLVDLVWQLTDDHQKLDLEKAIASPGTKMSETKAAIHHQTQIAQVRYALGVLAQLQAKSFSPGEEGGSAVWTDDIDDAIQAQQTRLDELTNAPKGIGSK